MVTPWRVANIEPQFRGPWRPPPTFGVPLPPGYAHGILPHHPASRDAQDQPSSGGEGRGIHEEAAAASLPQHHLRQTSQHPSRQMLAFGLPPGMMLVSNSHSNRGPVYPIYPCPVMMPPQHHTAAYYGGMPMPMPPWGYHGCPPGGIGYSYGTAMPPPTMPTTYQRAFPMAVPQIRATETPPLAAPHRGVKRSAEPMSPTCSRESNAPQRKLLRVMHLCEEEWAASLQVNFTTISDHNTEDL